MSYKDCNTLYRQQIEIFFFIRAKIYIGVLKVQIDSANACILMPFRICLNNACWEHTRNGCAMSFSHLSMPSPMPISPPLFV